MGFGPNIVSELRSQPLLLFLISLQFKTFSIEKGKCVISGVVPVKTMSHLLIDKPEREEIRLRIEGDDVKGWVGKCGLFIVSSCIPCGQNYGRVSGSGGSTWACGYVRTPQGSSKQGRRNY